MHRLSRHTVPWTTCLAMAAAIGCNAEPQQVEPPVPQTPPPAAADVSAEQYAVRGEVVSVDAEAATVTLDHEEIVGFMKAMTMPFKVQDPDLLEGLAKGDRVQGTLVRSDGQYVLTELQKSTE